MRAWKEIANVEGLRCLRFGEDGGAFMLPSPAGGSLAVVASDGGGWDHVSVSRSDRAPTWDEMELVKHAFFHADETAMQLHVPPSEHINVHPNCLHIWRPQRVKIPRPPSEYV